jgi:hypothetical protein
MPLPLAVPVTGSGTGRTGSGSVIRCLRLRLETPSHWQAVVHCSGTAVHCGTLQWYCSALWYTAVVLQCIRAGCNLKDISPGDTSNPTRAGILTIRSSRGSKHTCLGIKRRKRRGRALVRMQRSAGSAGGYTTTTLAALLVHTCCLAQY